MAAQAASTVITVASLPLGFRFHPTDIELVCYYLKRKVYGLPLRFEVISEENIYKSEPWDLPGKSKLKSKDMEWYFFVALDRKYCNGPRTNRATEKGYWKSTGKDRSIRWSDQIVGMKKTLVFHMGRAPGGERTNWVIHEYKLVDKELAQKGGMEASYVLCRIFQKSGAGPKIGEQYGAPFMEEDWEDTLLVPVQESQVEVGDEEFFDGVERYIQENYVEQNPDINMGIPLLEATLIPSSSYSVAAYNYIDDPMSFVEDDQMLLIDSDECDDLPELSYNQNFLDLRQQHQMNPSPLEESHSEALQGLVIHLGVDHPDDHPVEEPRYFHPFHNPQVDNTHSLEHGNLYDPVEAGLSCFDKVDDCLAYFDAIDLNSQFAVQDFDIILHESDLTPEEMNKLLASPHPLEIDGGEGASSSKQIPVSTELVQDAKFNEDCDSTTNNWISRMLGSIDAPPAFASEFPIKKVVVGHSSTTLSSNPIHANAERIPISGNKKEWLGSVGSVLVLCALGFFLIWVLIVSMAFKIGSYIYNR